MIKWPKKPLLDRTHNTVHFSEFNGVSTTLVFTGPRTHILLVHAASSTKMDPITKVYPSGYCWIDHHKHLKVTIEVNTTGFVGLAKVLAPLDFVRKRFSHFLQLSSMLAMFPRWVSRGRPLADFLRLCQSLFQKVNLIFLVFPQISCYRQTPSYHGLIIADLLGVILHSNFSRISGWIVITVAVW
jgi:hypothetical protein